MMTTIDNPGTTQIKILQRHFQELYGEMRVNPFFIFWFNELR